MCKQFLWVLIFGILIISLAEPTHYVPKRAGYAPSYLLKDGWKTQNARATRISQNGIISTRSIMCVRIVCPPTISLPFYFYVL